MSAQAPIENSMSRSMFVSPVALTTLLCAFPCSFPRPTLSLPRLSQPRDREVCAWRPPQVPGLWHTQNPSAEIRPVRKKRTSAKWGLCVAAPCPSMSMLFFERRGSVSRCAINAHFRCWPWMRARQHCLVGARWKLPRRVWHVASVRFFRTGRERFRAPCKIYTHAQVFCTSWQAPRRGRGMAFAFQPPPLLPSPARGRAEGGLCKKGST